MHKQTLSLTLWAGVASVLALAGVVLVYMGAAATAAPPQQSLDQGGQIFQQKCSGCHTFGRGATVGPDLKGVSARRDADWLRNWISAPDRMLAQKDPIATELLKRFNGVPMPNMFLSAAEVDALLSYLATDGAGSGAGAGPAPAALPAGDTARGKELFTGAARFQNGGPPCMACHSIAGIGALGGGALGPDLTTSHQKFGEAGMDSILQSFPFPTMNPVWKDHPVTPDERAQLLAFLKSAGVAQRPSGSALQLAALALVGAAVLVVLAQLFWRRRLAAVRRPMVQASGRSLSANSNRG